MIHLDTSFLIRALVRGSPEDQVLREWIAAGESLGMSAIAWAEFLCGPIDEAVLSLASVIVERRLDYTEAMAVTAARLFNGAGRRRGSMVDCMIAAAAIETNAAIATANPADFGRFRVLGLALAREQREDR